ncbi:hypothetical protein [Mesorhizobium sp. Z1-4]|uniref:hypothetical protein n=1 Tax=Mesorhizobium sp. Z1-4 TaxID=2448478 RepID=UPI000FD70AE5|nr:hypothetical protein [Mesorhizobium sp. Z1-4]
MNVFDRIRERDIVQSVTLGIPLGKGSGPFLARMNAMALMTGGHGFRQPKKGPKLSKNGTTRKEREAPGKRIYRENMEAERRFREAHADQPGWGSARINRAIERGDHLRA